MPLLIATRLASSPIHGLGLFAEEAVAAGTPVWAFDARIDRLLEPDDAVLAEFPQVARLVDFHGCVIEGIGVLLPGDDARFLNHADGPSIGRADPGDWRRFVARRDIAAGEEITCNYEDICADVREAGAALYLTGARAGAGE
ncbi:SET domain-containing protein [Azospirillum brasilense]|uniref:SET domain-containing protein n=1 Tax=Azospirillum brasilense TaxID=192 RepID=UPI001ED9DC87|nr:SET domain-containing protein [Azospirillum brasilense]UKJ75007.1 SET domain-containing protein [Azospirillum brasilense]